MIDDKILSEDEFAFSPAYPGHPLSVGSFGLSVSIMQSYLNGIKREKYPDMTLLAVDGKFGDATKNTVMQYQSLTGLPVDGIIGLDTWNAIVDDYENIPIPTADEYPGTVLRPGSSGIAVANMQSKLNGLSTVYSAIKVQIVDGKFGQNTTNATRIFQKQFNLAADGLIGPLTWNKIVTVYNEMMKNSNTKVTTEYPGNIITTGSSGDDVRFIQSYMNRINDYNAYSWNRLVIDGIYGSNTKQTVINFQNKYNLKIDGIVGRNTWNKMLTEFNKTL